MKFIRRHRFKIIISFLVALLAIVSFYMLWVHVPYAQNENHLTSIKNKIITTNGYKYEDYFNEYKGNSIYYILKVSKDKESKYVVHDKDKKYIKSYDSEVFDAKKCKNKFKDKYKVEATKIEIGYENDSFVYCLTYKGKDTLIYAFYRLDTGEFIKAYQV